MLTQIGRIVRDARGRAALSVDELAKAAAVPATSIEALEAGKPGMTTTQLEHVARALCLAPAALLRGRAEVKPEPSVFLRHSGVMDFDEVDLPKLDKALDQGQLILELAKLTNEPPGLWRSELFAPRAAAGDRPEAAAQEGYSFARAVRRSMTAPKLPLGDMRELLEDRFEIAVLVVALESTRVTALSIRVPQGAAVVLNDRDPERAANPVLARVHLAHELCHVLFDPSAGGVHLVVDVVSDRRDLRAEQRARGFAAELLLPLEGLVDRLGTPRATADSTRAEDIVAQAREHFRTPYEITVNHLANLGFLAPEIREWLVAGDRRASPLIAERTSLPQAGGNSVLLGHRVQRAHELRAITDGEARNALGIDALAPLPWDV